MHDRKKGKAVIHHDLALLVISPSADRRRQNHGWQNHRKERLCKQLTGYGYASNQHLPSTIFWFRCCSFDLVHLAHPGEGVADARFESDGGAVPEIGRASC